MGLIACKGIHARQILCRLPIANYSTCKWFHLCGRLARFCLHFPWKSGMMTPTFILFRWSTAEPLLLAAGIPLATWQPAEVSTVETCVKIRLNSILWMFALHKLYTEPLFPNQAPPSWLKHTCIKTSSTDDLYCHQQKPSKSPMRKRKLVFQSSSLSFQYTGWFKGIPLLDHYNPQNVR